MPWTIEEALRDDAIEKTEETNSGYSIWLKGLRTEVRIILYTNPLRGGFNFYQSHFIHTPKQAGPYVTGVDWGDDEAYALHRAVTTITQHYKDAVAAGLAPSESWLVPNTSGI